MEENKILIGKKPKKEWEPVMGWGQVIEMMWSENGEIKIWKKEPPTYKIQAQPFYTFSRIK